MKIHSIDQSLKCSQCRATFVLRTCRRLMNFTSGEILFFCQRCRAKIGYLTFARWNALNRAYFENPTPPPSPERPQAPREGRRRRRDRGFRNRDRGGPPPPRQSSGRS